MFSLKTIVFSNLILTVLSICEPNSRYRITNLPADESSHYVTFFNKSYISDCGCEKPDVTCVRKCCDEGYVFDMDEEKCVVNSTIKLDITIYRYRNVLVEGKHNVRFVSGVNWCLLEEDDDNLFVVGQDEFYMQTDGRLWLRPINTFFEIEHYCIDYDEDEGPMAVLCILQYDTQALDISDRISIIGMTISLPFLFLTFLVYSILPLRNMHGKALMCYVLSLFVAYSLVVVTDNETGEHTAAVCTLLAMSFYYFSQASFMWMNVMCIDIYLTFNGPKVLAASKKRIERRRFILYSIYAWSVPMFLVIIVQTFSYVFKPNRWYNPGVTDQDCWLNDGIPEFVYLYLPMSIVIVANITLFSITVFKIRQVQKDTAVLRNTDSSKSSDDTIRFGVYLKLFLAMGVNWSTDIIAWAINWQVEKVPPAVWYFTDLCNAAFGLIIFIIFVCNKKVWKLLKKKYYKIIGKTPEDMSSTDHVTMHETTSVK